MSTRQRVIDEAIRWGVVVELSSTFSRHGGQWAPKHDGRIFAPGAVVWNSQGDPLEACGLWHEVLHALLWWRTGIAPSMQDEFGAMLWMEIEGQRRMRLPWRRRWQGDSTVPAPADTEWRELTRREQVAFIATSRALAHAAGFVDATGAPTYVAAPNR